MTQNSNRSRMTKRKRGRPAGSISYVGDDAALQQLARLRLEHPDTSFAALARRLGFTTDSAIKRLQRKWNARAQELITAADLERKRRASLGPLESALAMFAQVGGWAELAVRSAPIKALRQSFEVVSDKSKALEALGLAQEPPFDVSDPQRVAEAIARFEHRDHRTLEDLCQNFPEGAELSDLARSERFYAMALIFYASSLDAQAAEEAEAQRTRSEGEADEHEG